jgi:hypothetical protein
MGEVMPHYIPHEMSNQTRSVCLSFSGETRRRVAEGHGLIKAIGRLG